MFQSEILRPVAVTPRLYLPCSVFTGLFLFVASICAFVWGRLRTIFRITAKFSAWVSYLAISNLVAIANLLWLLSALFTFILFQFKNDINKSNRPFLGTHEVNTLSHLKLCFGNENPILKHRMSRKSTHLLYFVFCPVSHINFVGMPWYSLCSFVFKMIKIINLYDTSTYIFYIYIYNLRIIYIIYIIYVIDISHIQLIQDTFRLIHQLCQIDGITSGHTSENKVVDGSLTPALWWQAHQWQSYPCGWQLDGRCHSPVATFPQAAGHPQPAPRDHTSDTVFSSSWSPSALPQPCR